VVAANTPQPLVRKINRDVNRILGAPEVRQQLQEQGFDVIGGSTAEFEQVVATDTVKFAKVIRDAGIKAD
jgi:tripartite-type tricarboxylate transporter receptor subunit TctC